ncbi:hypothetical protein [Anaerorhabdus sp.]|uniref:hypothetical protein n=1 Tax=Anaerorhabdus sp. TaxID=1872524 RepID=UPI002FC9F192
MTYIKFILLVVGLVVVMIARSTYTKRINSCQSKCALAYNQKEKIISYLGYALLGAAALLAAFNI